MPLEKGKGHNLRMPASPACGLNMAMAHMSQALVISFLILCTQSVVAVRRRLVSVADPRATFASPNYTVYHRQDDLMREVVNIVKANPEFMKLEVFSENDGNYNVEMKVVTVEPGGFSNRQHEKIHLLLDFGEHGRELISSELGLLFLKILASREGVMRVFPGELDRGRELQRLLEGTVIKVLPMENEGGRRLVEAGRLCERKNGRGVDPNRNWEVDWGNKEPDYDPNEEYPGTAPFSEPETKVLRRLAEEFKPQVWVNVHSGMEAMLAPWDHVAEVAIEARPSVDILQRILHDIMGNTTCVVGSGGKAVGYLAHGTATDYMFKILQVPIAYTWEIYGDFKAHFDDCFRMFNPLDEAGVKDVLQRWLRAIMRLVELMPGHPALKDSKAWSHVSTTTTTTTSHRGGGLGDGAQPQGTSEDLTASGSQLAREDGGQKNVQGGGTAPTPGAGATTTNPNSGSTSSSSSTMSISSSSHTSNSSSITGSTQQQEQQKESHEQLSEGGNISSGSSNNSSSRSASVTVDQPRIAVVASSRGWGSSWSTEISSGLLAAVGLAVVGVLAYRYGIRGLRSGGSGSGSISSSGGNGVGHGGAGSAGRRFMDDLPSPSAGLNGLGGGLAGRKSSRVSV